MAASANRRLTQSGRIIESLFRGFFELAGPKGGFGDAEYSTDGESARVMEGVQIIE